jgi:hypothetical protein
MQILISEYTFLTICIILGIIPAFTQNAGQNKKKAGPIDGEPNILLVMNYRSVAVKICCCKVNSLTDLFRKMKLLS